MKDTGKYRMVMKEVEEILPKSPLHFDLMHAQLTLKWVLRLKPDADDSLRIAALAHDMERAVTGITEKDLDDSLKLKDFKRDHALRSAKIITEIMERHGYVYSDLTFDRFC